jgi:hypothetical protein
MDLGFYALNERKGKALPHSIIPHNKFRRAGLKSPFARHHSNNCFS